MLVRLFFKALLKVVFRRHFQGSEAKRQSGALRGDYDSATTIRAITEGGLSGPMFQLGEGTFRALRLGNCQYATIILAIREGGLSGPTLQPWEAIIRGIGAVDFQYATIIRAVREGRISGLMLRPVLGRGISKRQPFPGPF